jgi:hypothetical protein
MDSSDYMDKYPQDDTGQEMGPSSRFWRTYNDEAAAFDSNMVDEYRDTLDVLLVFASVFRES